MSRTRRIRERARGRCVRSGDERAGPAGKKKRGREAAQEGGGPNPVQGFEKERNPNATPHTAAIAAPDCHDLAGRSVALRVASERRKPLPRAAGKE